MQLKPRTCLTAPQRGHKSKLIGTPWGRSVPCERCEPWGIYKKSDFYYSARKLKRSDRINAQGGHRIAEPSQSFHKSGSAILRGISLRHCLASAFSLDMSHDTNYTNIECYGERIEDTTVFRRIAKSTFKAKCRDKCPSLRECTVKPCPGERLGTET
jgi:hypothetical protein